MNLILNNGGFQLSLLLEYLKLNQLFAAAVEWSYHKQIVLTRSHLEK